MLYTREFGKKWYSIRFRVKDSIFCQREQVGAGEINRVLSTR